MGIKNDFMNLNLHVKAGMLAFVLVLLALRGSRYMPFSTTLNAVLAGAIVAVMGMVLWPKMKAAHIEWHEKPTVNSDEE